jgi:hypothetical protein
VKSKRISLRVITAAIMIFAGFFFINKYLGEIRTLKEIIKRLNADSRIAEVLVTSVDADAISGRNRTTIKFLEYDAKGNPLPPKYFKFYGNIIQFQSMVIRFDDRYVQSGHSLKGKSAYVFMKAFCLDGKNTESFDINNINEVPTGYEVKGENRNFQKVLWRRFWQYALDPGKADRIGIKNAQIEAPGTKFLPGILYTIKIEHDGGMRIDPRPLPDILKGEKVNF